MAERYKDASLSVDARVADLLERMTIEEKVGQLCQELAWKSYEKKGDRIEVAEQFRKLLSGAGIGSLYGVLRADPWTGVTLEKGLTPRQGAEVINAVQRAAIESTRLGIPLIFDEECSHGHMTIGATVFPVPITAASTWNPKLLREMTAAVAAETRVQGCTATCSPVLDVARDPRWGRTEETFGEDVFLCSRMGEAAVRGLQGDSLAGEGSIIATIKHFAAYGWPEGGHNGAPAHVGERELREVCLAPFRAAVKAGAWAVMSSYNEIDGLPCACDKRLLTDMLRGEWGFRGFVISDMGGIALIWNNHRAANDLQHAGIRALEAGVDIEMSGGAYGEVLLQAAREGKVRQEYVDRAVGRVLRAKFLLGLFEKPYCNPDRAAELLNCGKHRELAREIARQGIVLLKNDSNALPLKKDLKSIAVIGPNADMIYNQLGDYTAPQPREKIVSVLDGIRAAVSRDTAVRYALGCTVKGTSKAGFAEAVAAAKASDAAVVVVGGSSARDFGPDSYNQQTGAALVTDASQLSDMECGEGFDLANLNLMGVQLDLLKEIHATGVPLIAVLINGRPMCINWLADNAAAIIEAWYPGQEGGHAVADVLFGDYCPAGRLPVSVPRSAAQLPVYYAVRAMERGKYVDIESTPLYQFGYGLSYTTFKYENLRITPNRIAPGGKAAVMVDVTNTGKMAGDEVVQMYIRDEIGSVTRPVRELKGFRRITLAPGRKETVEFVVTPNELQMIDADMKTVVEPGVFRIMVGGNQTDVLTASLEVKAVS